ncbi:MAG: nitroreductase family deazaflavin-dependent oxidoreductase [Dehalococcoidia bacterium]|nr:nitroreductase family deazaflavin-dependent oxidoreductase [Dehalococcoidia bacterium]
MPVNRTLMKLGGQVHAFWYRLLGGQLVGRAYGSDIVLLTTTGRKSGQKRTATLLSMRDGDDIIVIASNGGNPMHPAWYQNLRANPEAEVQIGGEKKRVRAETAGREERARLWPRIVEMNAGYERYQQGTKRTIPVVVLKPVGR